MVFTDLIDGLAVLAGLSAIASLVWLAARPDRQRNAEDDAREFFDANGHWPDESAPPPGKALR